MRGLKQDSVQDLVRGLKQDLTQELKQYPSNWTHHKGASPDNRTSENTNGRSSKVLLRRIENTKKSSVLDFYERESISRTCKYSYGGRIILWVDNPSTDPSVDYIGD